MNAIFLLCLLAFLPGNGKRDVIRVKPGTKVWSQPASWNGGVPDRFDRVQIPGINGQTATVRLERLQPPIKAASLFVGGLRGTGTLVLKPDTLLQISGDRRQESKAGEIRVGASGDGFVFQDVGSYVRASRAVRIGLADGTSGEYEIRRATLEAAESTIIGATKASRGLLILGGADALLRTKSLYCGDGDVQIGFQQPGSGKPPSINVSKTAQLAGTIRVEFPDSSEMPDEVVLIRLGSNASRKGGFRNVLIGNPRGANYELTYTGGDGDDVAVVRKSAIRRYEKWATKKIGRLTQSADDDKDGLPAIGEYKLGRDPKVDEGSVFTRGVDEQGHAYIEYVERKDRADVVSVPQFSPDGRRWMSAGVTKTVVEKYFRQTLIRATYPKGVGSRFRVAFDLVPDADVRPNILFVMLDDLNDWTEGLGGHPQAKTPNLNRLAAGGQLFRNAHATRTICNPSRASILTGMLPSSTGVYANSTPFRNSPVLRNAVTLPEFFGNRGYHVCGAGKIFHKPEPRAWDNYFPSLGNHIPTTVFPASVPANGLNNVAGLDWGPLQAPSRITPDHRVASWVSTQLTKPGQLQEPFFLACGIVRPHGPMYAPQKYFDRFPRSEIQLPLVLQNDLNDLGPRGLAIQQKQSGVHEAIVAAGQWKDAVRAYLACTNYADDQIGRLLNALDSSPYARNTIIVLLSDHGWHLGEKNFWQKSTLWERSTHVPLIIDAPGVTQAGSICDEAVSLVDVYTTLTALTGFGTRRDQDGRNLVPLLLDPQRSRPAPAISTRQQFAHSARDERYRYTRYNDGEEELYDMLIDPLEWDNLAGDESYRSVMDELGGWFPQNDLPSVGSIGN